VAEQPVTDRGLRGARSFPGLAPSSETLTPSPFRSLCHRNTRDGASHPQALLAAISCLDTIRYNKYHDVVTASLSSKGKRQGAACPEEAAFLDLLRTCDLLSRGPAQLLRAEDLSATQYNVLRILRGARDGLPCGEIANRMITRDPDVTRLLDRLEKRGLIARWRESRDRRMVLARITPGGLKLLAHLDEPVQEVHRRQLGHLGKDRLRALAALLGVARAKTV